MDAYPDQMDPSTEAPERAATPHAWHPTTTHAEWGSGHPRLLVHSDQARFERRITEDELRIGSTDGCDVRLVGTDPIHAEIQHDDRDEYVLTMYGPGDMSSRPAGGGSDPRHRTATLRSGSRFTVGEWTFVFMRDEESDHGLPYGGHQGGEGSRQRSQPARPDYGHH